MQQQVNWRRLLKKCPNGTYTLVPIIHLDEYPADIRRGLEKILAQIFTVGVRVRYLGEQEDDGSLVLIIDCPYYKKGNEVVCTDAQKAAPLLEKIFCDALKVVLGHPFFEVERFHITYDPYVDHED